MYMIFLLFFFGICSSSIKFKNIPLFPNFRHHKPPLQYYEGDRQYPLFSLIGVPKMGTSALWELMNRNPIFSRQDKEAMPLSPSLSDYINALPRLNASQYWFETCIRVALMEDYAKFYSQFVSAKVKMFIIIGEPLQRIYSGFRFWCTSQEKLLKICLNSGNWAPKHAVNITGGVYIPNRTPIFFHRYMQERESLCNGDNDCFGYRELSRTLRLFPNITIIPQNLLLQDTPKMLRYILFKLNLPDFPYSDNNILINTNDARGISAEQLKQSYKFQDPLLETRQIFSNEICYMADLLTSASEWDFNSIWNITCTADSIQNFLKQVQSKQ